MRKQRTTKHEQKKHKQETVIINISYESASSLSHSQLLKLKKAVLGRRRFNKVPFKIWVGVPMKRTDHAGNCVFPL